MHVSKLFFIVMYIEEWKCDNLEKKTNSNCT